MITSEQIKSMETLALKIDDKSVSSIAEALVIDSSERPYKKKFKTKYKNDGENIKKYVWIKNTDKKVERTTQTFAIFRAGFGEQLLVHESFTKANSSFLAVSDGYSCENVLKFSIVELEKGYELRLTESITRKGPGDPKYLTSMKNIRALNFS